MSKRRGKRERERERERGRERERESERERERARESEREHRESEREHRESERESTIDWLVCLKNATGCQVIDALVRLMICGTDAAVTRPATDWDMEWL